MANTLAKIWAWLILIVWLAGFLIVFVGTIVYIAALILSEYVL
jgi:hypothetical protein